MSVLLRFKDSDYHIVIFTLFLQHSIAQRMQTHTLKEKASMNELSNNLNLKLEGQRLYEIHMIAFLNTNLSYKQKIEKSERVSEFLLNANSIIFQLYQGQIKLIFNEMMRRSSQLDFV